MQIWVGITDGDWFQQLADDEPDEVNFWRPSSSYGFKAVTPGSPFLFKLHSPRNYIVGGGFFVRDTMLPVSVAWDAFGAKNGARTRDELLARIQKYRRDKSGSSDPVIGCTILTEPFFLNETEWVPVPEDWALNIVRGRTYDTNESHGAALWAQVKEAILRRGSHPATEIPIPQEDDDRAGSLYLARSRLGQGAFRVLVTDAYDRRCAITGERTLPVLEAAHIKPHALSGPNRVKNGLLLRSDLHILFDRGYVTVTPDYRVEVSKCIREEYENGRDYYALSGRPLVTIPRSTGDRPSEDFVRWHNQNVYRG